MNNQQDIQVKKDEKSKIIHEILYKLDTELNNFLNEVQKSYALYKVGEKTDIVKEIEKIIDDPLDNLIEISDDIDNKIVFFIDAIVNKYFNQNKKFINKAFKLNTLNKNQLFYIIVLKKDTTDNRQKLFDFLDDYELTRFANKYKIDFKFIDEDLVSGFNIEKNIDV